MPEITVVVASHNRALRLRWLLNALEEQDLDRDRWEVVVAHDSTDDGLTEALLEHHPLAADGTLRGLRLAPGAGNSASRLRNAAWNAAQGELIAFTDDDCRPPAGWVRRALDAGRRHPGAIVQGTTRADPDEAVEESGGYVHRQNIDPPSPQAETCNIVYPREVLARIDGFTEHPPLAVGEDTDLMLRARAAGVEHVPAPELLTYHAIHGATLAGVVRGMGRWSDLAWLYRRHPEVRHTLHLGMFWKRTHLWLPLALLGLLRARSNPLWLALVLPWYHHSVPWRGAGLRGRLRSLSESPGRLVYDAAELAAVVRGAVRHRWPVL